MRFTLGIVCSNDNGSCDDDMKGGMITMSQDQQPMKGQIRAGDLELKTKPTN